MAKHGARSASRGRARTGFWPWLLLVGVGCAGGSPGPDSGNPAGAGSIAGQYVELETMVVPYPLGHWDTTVDEATQTVRFAQMNVPGGEDEDSVQQVVIGALCDTTVGTWVEEEASYTACLSAAEEQLAVLPVAPSAGEFDSADYSQVTVHGRSYRVFDYSRQVQANRAGGLAEETGRLYVYLPDTGRRQIFLLLISNVQAPGGETPSFSEMEVVLDGFVPMP